MTTPTTPETPRAARMRSFYRSRTREARAFWRWVDEITAKVLRDLRRDEQRKARRTP